MSKGETREEALANLDEALEGYHSDGREFTDGERREDGVDPERSLSGEPQPDVFE